MSKSKKAILAVAALLLAVTFALFGCESFSQKPIEGGDASALVESNGGLAVKQGDYIYFVNGKAETMTVPEDNYFGNVLKGSIMRGKLENGQITNANVVVPKMMASISKDAGFSVYGEWIYYVSPSIKTDSKGTLNANEYIFYRTKIDGTNTQEIAVATGSSLKYKFSPTGLSYFISNKLYFVDYAGKANASGIKATEIENVTAVFYTQSQTYDPGSDAVNYADFFFYTKSVLDEDDVRQNFNEVYAASCDGRVNKLLLHEKTYSDDPTNLEQYTFDVKAALPEADGVTLFYNKTYTTGQSTVNQAGLFGAKFTSADFNFDKTKEVRYYISDTALSKIMPISLTEGIYVYDSTSKPYILKPMNGNELVKVECGGKSSMTPMFIQKEALPANAGEGYYVYYNSGSNIGKMPIMTAAGDKFEHNETLIVKGNVSVDFAMCERIGNYFFYINSGEYNYTYMFDAANLNPDYEKNSNVLIGTMTEADAKAKEEADKNK